MSVQLKRLDPILKGLRARKKILLSGLKGLSAARAVLGNCAKGDCASSFHLQFEDAETAALYGRKLRAAGLLFAPVTTRPAHACWKWAGLLSENAFPRLRNPYLETDRKYSYSTAQYLASVDVLMRTYKLNVDLSLSLNETAKLARKLAKALANG